MQDTYGTYAELRHKAEEMVNELKETTDDGNQGSDIMAQRDYMDTVSRNYAKRLERRRNLVITSVRFHRLAEDVSSALLTLLSVFNYRLVSNIYQGSYRSLKCSKVLEIHHWFFKALKSLKNSNFLVKVLKSP